MPTLDLLAEWLATFIQQLQKPTLAFLFGGMALAALGSRFEIPDAIYRFIVALLLLKIGMGAGIEIRHANLVALALPALGAVVLGMGIVLVGRVLLLLKPGLQPADAIATAGLFGAVSASTLAAAMVMLEDQGVPFEGWVPALYPFMDMAALLTAIVLAQLNRKRGSKDRSTPKLKTILVESLQGAALSALALGLVIGFLSRPEVVYESFYQPLFYGLLSVLMLIMGMEAWSRLTELRKVAHIYLIYAIGAPLLHGLAGFAMGYLAHVLTGFSPGGAILLAVMAASSSDISGPPTLRAAIPSANPSAYIGTSTGLGTPIALLSIPLWIALGPSIFGY